MKYGVIVQVKHGWATAMCFQVSASSILDACAQVDRAMSEIGLIPVSMSIHEFGESIYMNENSTYWPARSINRGLYKQLK